METKKLHVKLKFTEPVLGMTPGDSAVYESFIGSKAPDAMKLEEEVAAYGVDDVIEKGMTVFPKLDDGTPFMWDYQIKGFFKDSCGALSRCAGKDPETGRKRPRNESAKIRAYKKIIDGVIFVDQRRIPIVTDKPIGLCQRPLRAQTMQGERVALAMSEEIAEGATMEFDVSLLSDEYEAAVREWFEYGRLRGLGQWRNSGKGRFIAEVT